MDHDNSQARSQLRQPRKIASPGKGLSEMSVSANNARATTLMPPPGSISLKHKGSALPEPAAKRKTLAERAGEVPGSGLPAPATSRFGGPGLRGTTLLNARQASVAASTLTRAAAVNGHETGISNAAGAASRVRPPSAQSRQRSRTTDSNAASQTPAPIPGPPSSTEGSLMESCGQATGKRKAWDTKGRLEDMEVLYSELRQQMSGATAARNGLEEHMELYKSRICELETLRTQLSTDNTRLQMELSQATSRLMSVTTTLEEERRAGRLEIDGARQKYQEELDSVRSRARDETDSLVRCHREELSELEHRLKTDFEDEKGRLKMELDDEKARHARDVQEATSQNALDRQKADVDADAKDREIANAKREMSLMQDELDRERSANRSLHDRLSEASANAVALESSRRALNAKIDFLESDCQSQAKSFTDLDRQLQDAVAVAKDATDKLRKEETLRRILHNQVQELKGNIRVFCRVRPWLQAEAVDAAKISFPDADKEGRELEVLGYEEKSSLGHVSRKRNAFAFDRIFNPESSNQEIFEEISQLVQSALDGYNVCIFCYGQTGSGKTHTMSSDDGMIPRAVQQIYETAKGLEEKGWSYTMEGSFLEVHNENLNDLLGRAEEFDKKKLEIKHDQARGKTHVTGLTAVNLDCPSKVEAILRKAATNRSVAATKANERSSRSHSVFILRLVGVNKTTGEQSEGTLNLVDLAGSERLSQSGATGERLKETKNINRSLSCLGDVIGALGQGKDGAHIPYRNSKLTYLLQFSLGGNSKTLMFVMISPLQAHLNETLTSLKFATKVHNTHIGTAKRQSKVKD
ncbi:MAG: hypothetical protein M1825_001486 [Sarcosagium campestre]|nr:MAG: hypothetical protein M1825_001486 [Sarcosagium campestre]